MNTAWISRLSLALLLASASFLPVHAQQEGDKPFSHLDVAAGIGLSGITIEASTPLYHRLHLRAGIEGWPTLKDHYENYLDASKADGKIIETDQERPHLPESNERVSFRMKDKIRLLNGKILLDWYLSKNRKFHVTAGAYIGQPNLYSTYSQDPELLRAVYEINNSQQELIAGCLWDDYLLTPDSKGKIEARQRINIVKPYVGMGWGGYFKRTPRLSMWLEIGMIFNSKPKETCNGLEIKSHYLKTDYEPFKCGISFGDRVYPVLSYKLRYRIF